MTEPRHLDYLDALRGYAILMVIFVHVSLHYPDLPSLVIRLLGTGVEGVWLFFVVSAFTLTRSWTLRGDGAAAFYVRRLFRIGPMWWTAMAGWILASVVFGPHWGQVAWPDILTSATFTAGLSVTTVDTLVPGGWSTTSEAMFYLLFPLLLAVATTPARAAIVAMLAVVIAAIFQGELDAWMGAGTSPAALGHYFFFAFPRHVPTFVLGIAAYHAAQTITPSRPVAEAAVGLALILILLAPLASFGVPLVYGAIFGLLIFGMTHGGGRYLVNRVIVWIGQRSYSAYFWHFAVLFPATELLRMPFGAILAFVLAVTLVLSQLSYTLIELPGIRLGKRVLERWRPPVPDTVAASSRS